MKKLITMLLALGLVATLGACGGEENKKDSHKDVAISIPGIGNVGDIGDINLSDIGDIDLSGVDIGSIMGGAGADTVWGKQDEATKQAIIAGGKQNGMDISFAHDGTMTMVDPSTGDTYVQNPDGSWIIGDEEGGLIQTGKWPDNEFTKLLPKPDFTVLSASTDADRFTASFNETTVEKVKAYVEAVKAKGFTVNGETTDEKYEDIVYFLYSAENEDGYKVDVTYAAELASVTLTKPVEEE